MRPVSQHRVGRRRSTTWDHISNVAIDLFAARGFDEVSVDDVAEAAGIARRTLFRYYPSKNAMPWGDFDAHLDHMRDLLDDVDPDVPIEQALRAALLAFNSFDEQETARHRQRMRVILETAALQAYSMTMYAGWRAVVAAFVAQRLAPRRKTSCRRPWRGQCSEWRCRPTSTGWPTNRCPLLRRWAMRSTRSAMGCRRWTRAPLKKFSIRASEFGPRRRR